MPALLSKSVGARSVRERSGSGEDLLAFRATDDGSDCRAACPAPAGAVFRTAVVRGMRLRGAFPGGSSTSTACATADIVAGVQYQEAYQAPRLTGTREWGDMIVVLWVAPNRLPSCRSRVGLVPAGAALAYPRNWAGTCNWVAEPRRAASTPPIRFCMQRGPRTRRRRWHLQPLAGGRPVEARSKRVRWIRNDPRPSSDPGHEAGW